MKKFIKFIVGLVVLIVLLVVVGLTLVATMWLGPLVKATVEEVGPQALGTKVKVEDVDVKLLRGKIQIQGVVVGNPEEFQEPSAITVGNFQLSMDIGSLRTDKVMIDEILIDRPEITYEKTKGGNNLKSLQQNVEKFTEKLSKAPGESKEEDSSGDRASSKKVVIKRLLISNGVVHAKLRGLPVVTLDLPQIERTDIGGGADGGTTVGQAAEEVIGSLINGVTDHVSGASDMIKDRAGQLLDGGKGLGDKATDAVKGLGDLIKK